MSKPSASFNFASDKIVNLVEWKLKSRKLLNKEYSVKDKLLTYLFDTPLCSVAGVGLMIKGAFNKKARAGLYVDKKRHGFFGIYTTGAAVADMMKIADRFILSEKRREKMYDVAQRGFDQSEDVRNKPVVARRLKPL